MPLILLDHGPQERELLESLLRAERAQDAIAQWAGAVHAEQHPVGPTQPHMLTYRVLAETLQRNVMRSSRVRIQWAPPALLEFLLESDGMIGHHADPSWGPFGAAAEHVYQRMHPFTPRFHWPIVPLSSARSELGISPGADPTRGHQVLNKPLLTPWP